MMMPGRYANLHGWWHHNDKNLAGQGSVPLYTSSPLGTGNLTQYAGYKTMWVGKTRMSAPFKTIRF